jgi:hypothetical protein
MSDPLACTSFARVSGVGPGMAGGQGPGMSTTTSVVAGLRRRSRPRTAADRRRPLARFDRGALDIARDVGFDDDPVVLRHTRLRPPGSEIDSHGTVAILGGHEYRATPITAPLS